MSKFVLTTTALAGAAVAAALFNGSASGSPSKTTTDQLDAATAPVIRYGTESIDGLDIFYREAGDSSKPQIVLLHGFPTSSHMFRDLIPKLASDFHVIAPDYPGYGLSSAPSADEYEYSFDALASVVDELLERRGFDSYALYLMDYGAPVGYRIATAHPERVTGLVVQNGNAYVEGLREFWDPIKAYWESESKEDGDALRGLLTIDATKWQYQNGTRNPDAISPDSWLVVQPLLDRPGNQEVQLALFLDYRSNVPLYPSWQKYLRDNQPPTLILWGKNDAIFPAEGAHPYLRDLPNAELHLLDTGHFALEEDGPRMAKRIKSFLLSGPAVKGAAR